jgi:DNA-binding NtrC family response regulator
MATKNRPSILVVDDEETVRLYLQSILGKTADVVLTSNGTEALEALANHPADIVLLDLMLGDGEDGISLLRKIKERRDDVDVVIVSGVRTVKTVVDAMKEGAADYLSKPIDRDDLFLMIRRVQQKRELQNQNQALREELVEDAGGNEIIGTSRAIEEVKSMVARLRDQEVNVLLVGETGTGKEVFARFLHWQEGDPKRPFISVNCAAIPENLLESVLFGHEKGAFTGATETRIGKFELANGGDIFLDEIGCLNSELQAKLLRVLEEKEVERVGGKVAKKSNFRVISAYNEDILKIVADGKFRSDLFYRLNTVTIQLPPLSERREDIIPLVEHFLRKYKRGTDLKTLSPELKEILENHSWRGNVRELRNTVENMIIFSKGSVLFPSDLPFLKNGHSPAPRSPEATAPSPAATSAGPPALFSETTDGKYDDVLREFEKRLILKTLERNRWSKTKACREMGISRNKLYRKLNDLGIPA